MMLASREIKRAKARFGLLIGAVGLLVFLILFQWTLLGSLLQGFTGGVENQSAPVLVYGKDARKIIEASVLPPAVVDAVGKVDGVASAAPWYSGTFTVDAAGVDVDATIIGFRPGAPGQPTRVVEGRLPAAPGEAVASKEDRKKGFDIGSTVISTAGDVPLTIVGLTELSRSNVAPTMFVTEEGFTALRKAANPDAKAVFPSLVAVQPAPGVDPAVLATRITEQVPGTEALTRTQAIEGAPGVGQIKTSFYGIIGLAYVVVVLVIGFFLLILTVQKMPSLVLMRAVGAPVGALVRGILEQMLFVVGGGLIVGLVFLYGAVAAAKVGLPLQIDTGAVAVISLAVVIGALLASTFAFVRVAAIDPFDVVAQPNLGGS
jgi:putative ABC transport system permease protein